MKHQSKKSKLDEALSMKHGKESEKKESFASRRHESMGAKKHHARMGMKAKEGHKSK
jgi:hypothetical protein